MREKIIIGAGVLISIGLILGGLSIGNSGGDDSGSVRDENGTQIISIIARGGYSPRQIKAAADKPTRLDVETRGTYDCSAALTIPQLDYKEMLPATGKTAIEIPPQKAGSKLTGLCQMGMYSFEIDFS